MIVYTTTRAIKNQKTPTSAEWAQMVEELLASHPSIAVETVHLSVACSIGHTDDVARVEGLGHE